MEVLGTDEETMVAYLFRSPAGRVMTVVNVGNEAVEVQLSVPDVVGRFRDEVSGEVVDGREDGLSVSCRGHSVRMLREE